MGRFHSLVFINLVAAQLFVTSLPAQSTLGEGGLKSNPAFSPWVDDSLDWQPLNADLLEQVAERQQLLFVFSPPQEIRGTLLERVHAALSSAEFIEAMEGKKVALASPAWRWLLKQGCFFSNGSDLAQTSPGIPCGTSAVLILNGEGNVVGFQTPGFLEYETQDLVDFVGVYYGRHARSPQVSGYNSGLARARQFELIRGGLGLKRDTSSLATLAGSVLAMGNRSRAANPGDYALRAIRMADYAQLSESFSQRLEAAAAKVLDYGWAKLDEEGAELFGADPQGSGREGASEITQIPLWESCQVLLAEAKLEDRDAQARARAEALLARLDERFLAPNGQISEYLLVDEQGNSKACGWRLLDTAALYAQVKLAWGSDPAEMGWLADLVDDSLGSDSPSLPPSMDPSVPGEPVSVRGLALLGEACLRAADASKDQQLADLWVGRSEVLFQLLEQECSAGARGYWLLPENHPLSLPPEVIFTDLREPSVMASLGDWLRDLESRGVAEAGSRADELADSFAEWRQKQDTELHDRLLLQSLSLHSRAQR